MVHLIVQLSKYIMIILFLIYTFFMLSFIQVSRQAEKAEAYIYLQRFYIVSDSFMMVFWCLFVTTMDTKINRLFI